jgi:hypothetical protein
VRPSFTAAVIEAKLSSANTISAASSVTSVPLIELKFKKGEVHMRILQQCFRSSASAFTPIPASWKRPFAFMKPCKA